MEDSPEERPWRKPCRMLLGKLLENAIRQCLWRVCLGNIFEIVFEDCPWRIASTNAHGDCFAEFPWGRILDNALAECPWTKLLEETHGELFGESPWRMILENCLEFTLENELGKYTRRTPSDMPMVGALEVRPCRMPLENAHGKYPWRIQSGNSLGE